MHQVFVLLLIQKGEKTNQIIVPISINNLPVSSFIKLLKTKKDGIIVKNKPIKDIILSDSFDFIFHPFINYNFLHNQARNNIQHRCYKPTG